MHCNGVSPSLPQLVILTSFHVTPGGISLSPAFVVMYVMQHLQLSWEDALHMVQNRRYCISPNGGFLTQIKEYESIYKAKVAIAAFPRPQNGANTRRKREEDEDDDEDLRCGRPNTRVCGGG